MSSVEEAAVSSPDTTHADYVGADANDGSSTTSSSDATRNGAQMPQIPRLEYRNNANLIAPVRVDVTASASLRDQQITRAVRLTRPDLFVNGRPSHTYSSVSHAHRITIRQLGGGLSNHLYVVHPGGREEAVLVRIHAEDEEEEDNGEEADAGNDGADVCAASSSASAPTFVDREVENRVLAWLSSEGLAPTFHGRFTNGRVEEFYDGFRPLSWDELRLRRFAVPVARALANLHCAHPPEGVLNISEDQRNEGEIWSRISEWFDMATNSSSEVTEANDLMQTMKLEWEWLQATLRPSFNDVIVDSTSSMKCFDLQSHSGNMQSAASSYFRQIVFTHMDCQSLNILTPCEGFHLDYDSSDTASGSKNEGNVQETESKPEENDQEEGRGEECSYASVRLIDLEYAGVNPRAADIANTFSEYCNMNNLEPDYESQYPTSGQQDAFLRAYIETASPELAKQLDQLEDGWASFLAAARVVIGQHTLLSHIGWGIWAIAQESLSNIEFDYLKYARLRLEGYFHFKDRCFVRQG